MAQGEGKMYPAPTHERINELDAELARVQKSTRASFTIMIPIHDILRNRLRWYYNWHLNSYSSFIHWMALTGYTVAAFVLLFSIVLKAPSQSVLAASKQVWASSEDWNAWKLNNLVATDGGLKLATVPVKIVQGISTKLAQATPEPSFVPSDIVTPTPEVSSIATPEASPTLAISPTPQEVNPSVQPTAPPTISPSVTPSVSPSVSPTLGQIQYETQGTATFTFDPQKGEIVDWLKVESSTDLNGGTAKIELSTDNILWTEDVKDLADSSQVYLRVTLNSPDPSTSPVLKNLSVNYSRLPLTPKDLTVSANTNILGLDQSLSASAFSDPDGDLHKASEWQVTDKSGQYTTLLADSGVDTKNLTTFALSKKLKDGTYFFRVRYQDSVGAWSLWSEESVFSVSKNELLVLGEGEILKNPNEIVADRTATTKTIDNKNGTKTLESYSGIIHYKENYAKADSAWKDINSSHSIDFPTYVLYDQMPSTVKVYKDKIGYEIESRQTSEKYVVELQDVDGNPKVASASNPSTLNPKTSKLASIISTVLAQDATTSADANLKFEFDISQNGVRLWKTIEGADAPKNFQWKITKTGEGNTLKFRDKPEAYDISANGDIVKDDQGQDKVVPIEAKKIAGDMDSTFIWQETAPKSDMKIDTDVNFYPNADPEINTVDGPLTAYGSASTWATIRAEAGNNADSSNSAGTLGGWASADSGYYTLNRSAFLFNTSSIPDAATISAANFSIYGVYKEDGNSWGPSLNVYASNPSSNNDLVPSDFATLGTTAFSTAIPYASFNDMGYNSFDLNASGLAAISKNSVTKLGTMATADATNTDPGATSSWAYATLSGYFAENGVSTAPKLTVTYTGGNTVSGTIYGDDTKTTNVGSGVTVGITSNGGGKVTTTTGAGGTFSFTGVEVVPNKPVMVFTDDGNMTVLVTMAASATDITGLELYQYKTVVRHESGISAITNADLAIANDCNCLPTGSSPFSVTGSKLTIYDLFVPTGIVFTPGGDIDANHMVNYGTINMESHNFVQLGSDSLYFKGGTFNAGSGTHVLVSPTLSGGVINAQTSNLTIGNGYGGFNMTSGTFNGDSATITILNASFTMSGGTFNASSGNMTLMTDSNGYYNNYTWNISGGTFNHNNGTFTIGSILNNYNYSPYTFSNLPTLYNLVYANTGDGNISYNTGFTVANDLSVTNGSFSPYVAVVVGRDVAVSSGAYLSGSDITIGRNLTTTAGGTFSPYYVTFNTAQTSVISGDNTPYNFTCATAGKILSFAANSTLTINDNMTIQGSAGNNIIMKLNGTAGSGQWKINANTSGMSPWTVDYVTYSDSNNLNIQPIAPTNSTASGTNNTNWTGSHVSGTAYTDLGKSYPATYTPVSISVNGGAKQTTNTDGSGAFDFVVGGVTANLPITVFYEDGSNYYSGNLVTVSAGSGDITGLELYTYMVSLTYENSGPMTNTILATADNCPDANGKILFSVDGSNVLSNNYTLYIPASKVYTPGASVSTYGAYVYGTINASGTFTSSDMGSFYVENGGIFNAGSGSVTVGGLYLTGGTFNANTSTLVLNGYSTSISGGTFNSNTAAVTIKSYNFYLYSGTFNAPAGVLTLDANNVGTDFLFDMSGGGTFANNDGTVLINNINSANTYYIKSGSNHFYNLTANSANGTIATQDTLLVEHTIDITGANTFNAYSYNVETENFYQEAGTFSAPYILMKVSGDFNRSGGTFNNNWGTVELNGAAASTQVVSGSTEFYNLYAIGSAARTIQFAGSSTQTVTGNWTATGAADQLLTLARKTGDSGVWSINPTAWTVDYVLVSNSTNLASAIINPTNSTDGGGNINWFLTSVVAPTVTTSAATDIASISVTGNGNVTADGGATVTDRGFYNVADSSGGHDCSVAAAGTQVTAGSGTGVYTASIGSLTGSTYYCYRSYATNSAGTSYGAWIGYQTLSSYTISGTAYTSDAKSATVADGTTVGLSINGGVKSTVTTTTGGVFSFSGKTVAANDTLTLFLSGGTYTGNLVTQATDGTTDITGLELYANDVVLSYQTAGPMTNTLLATANNCTDCGTDIKFTDSAGAVTFTTGYKVWIATGKGYTPGGSVTADAMTIAGTFTPGANAVTLAGTGTPLVITGTFNAGTATINYTGGTTATNVTATTYYNLYLNHASTTYTAAGDITVSNVFTINAGTFDGSSRTITLSGTGTPFVKTGTFTPSTSTITYTGGTAAVNVTAATYYNLSVNKASTTYTAAGDITVSNVFTIAAGTFDASNRTITLSGNYVNSGTFTKSTSTVIFNAGATGKTITAGGSAFNIIIFNNAAGGWQLQDTLTATTFTVTNTETAGNGLDFNGQAVNITGQFTLTAGKVTAGASVITLSGTSTPFNKKGTSIFTAGTSTVKFTADAAVSGLGLFYSTAVDNAPYFLYNLEISPTITAARTYTVCGNACTVNVGGTFLINPNSTPNPYLLTVNSAMGQIVATGATTIQRTGSATSTFNGFGTFASIAVQSGATLNPNNTLTAASINIASGGTFTPNSQTINITGNTGTPLTNSGTFTPGTSRVYFKTDTAALPFSGVTSFYNLDFQPTLTASRTWTLPALTVSGTTGFTINPTAGSAYSLTITLGGDLNLSSTSGVLTVTRASSATSILDTSGTSYTITAGKLSIMTGGTVTANNSIITLTGSSTPFDREGTGVFTAGTSTVKFIADAPVGLFYNIGTPTQTHSLYNVEISPTITAARAYSICGNACIVNIGGTFLINPNSTPNPYLLTVNSAFGQIVATGATTIQRTGSATSKLITTAAMNFAALTIADGGEYAPGNYSTGVSGNMSIASGGTYTKNNTLTFNGTTTTTYEDLNTTKQDLGTVVITKINGTPSINTLTLNTNAGNGIKVDVLTISANNTLDLNTGGYTLELANAGATATVFTKTGTLTAGTSTVKYSATNSGGNVNIVVTPYYNLTIDNAAETYALAGATTINNNLTVAAGTLTSGANNITAGNVIVSGGVFTAPSASVTTGLTVNGDWNHSGGVFTHNSGQVNLAGLGGSTQVITGDTTFNNLSATGISARTIQFAGSSTQTVTGTWTATGAADQLLTLARKTGDSGVWSINPTAWTVNYASVSNSTNLASSLINPTNSTDGGGNTNWFPAPSTLTYLAGDGGSIVGTNPQTVNEGANGTEVVATPSAGYYFVNWSDAITTAARTDINVTNDITVTANFALQFLSKWDTSKISTGSSTATQIKLPLESAGTYNFTVDWGDSSTSTITTWNQAETTHTYASGGIYDLKIGGTITGFRFNYGGDKLKLSQISQFGPLRLGNSKGYFFGTSNLKITATDVLNMTGTTTMYFAFYGSGIDTVPSMNNWDMSAVTNMVSMFNNAIAFNQNIGSWNTGAVTNMSNMFGGTAFNQDIGNWNTGAVTNMNYMFSSASAFNQNISGWNTANVTDMNSMFSNASAFNQNIGSWNTAKVTNMSSMFQGASAFNQNIGSWNTAAVTNMFYMFWNASAFNQNIGSWNTAAVTNMSSMFQYASAFNQDISDWNVAAVTDMTNMFTSSALSTVNYSNILVGWSAQAVKSNVPLGAAGKKYTLGAAADARAHLVSAHTWTITDGGPSAFVLTYNAGSGGSIVGSSPQTIDYGANGTLVTATPATGYRFVSWSDNGSTTAARTDTNIIATLTTTATFASVTITPTSSAGFTVDWNDNPLAINGFELYIAPGAADCASATYPATASYTPVFGSTSQVVPALDEINEIDYNTWYCAKLIALTSGGPASPLFAEPKYTFANKPVRPTVNTQTADTATVKINNAGNPASTEFAVKVVKGANTRYLKTDGTLTTNSTPVWATYAAFGGDSGLVNTGLVFDANYIYSVAARNGDQVATAYSDTNTVYPPVAPTTCTWDGGGTDNNWSTATNWLSDAVPADGCDVIFNGAYTIKNSSIDSGFTNQIKSLLINTGYTGVVTAETDLTVTGDFALNNGTFVAGSYTLNIGGSVSIVASPTATFSKGTSTINFNPTDTGKTITTNGQLLGNLTFNGVLNIVSPSIKANNSVTLLNTGILVAGWTLQDSLNATSIVVNTGTLVDNSQAVIVAGNISISTNIGVLVSRGLWTQSASGSIANATMQNSFGSLSMAGAGVTTTLAGDLKIGLGVGVYGSLTIGDGTLMGNGKSILYYQDVNDGLTIGSVTAGSNLSALSIYPTKVANLTQKAITLPSNFATIVQFQQNPTAIYTATGNFNLANSNCFFVKDRVQTPTGYVNMSSYNLSCNNLQIGNNAVGYTGVPGYLKLGSGIHTITGNVAAGNALNVGNKLDFGSSNTSIAGNLDFTNITMVPGTSTINLNGSGGATQTITGSNTFTNLTMNADIARTVQFEGGKTQTVTGAWTATGHAGQYLTLARKTGSTGVWSINPTAWSVDYVDVANSTNLAVAKINPTNYVDSGSNTNWFETALASYTITASAGTGGSISPSGAVTVTALANKTFTITADAGYYINTVEVDGVARGDLSTYTFSSVGDDHTISATFTAYPTSIDNPTNFAGTVGDGKVTLSWTNPTSVYFDHIEIFQSIVSGELGDRIGDNIKTTTFSNTGLTNGQTYYYTLKAVDSLFNISSGTAQLALTPTDLIDLLPPSAPTNLRATNILGNSLTLKWNASTDNVGVTGYKLYNADTNVLIASMTDTTYDLKNLTPLTDYNFYVVALDAAGNVSSKSNVLNVRTLEGELIINTYLLLNNVPSEVKVGESLSGAVKVMAVDAGGALQESYTGSVYFTSTDTKAVLAYNSGHKYDFSLQNAGTHSFIGSNFKFNSVGNQKLSVTDGVVSGSAEINVLGLTAPVSEIFAKAQDRIDNLFANLNTEGLSPVATNVTTAIISTTAALLLAPLVLSAAIGMTTAGPQLLYFLNHLLQLMGIRPRRKPWGTIFNSQTGQPIPYAIVKIFDTEYNRLLETAVTNSGGRFGFLVQKGNYYVTVSKSGYIFPSTMVVSGFFDDTYKGGQIEPKDNDKTVTMNIPMDPQVKLSRSYKLLIMAIKINHALVAIRLGLLVAGMLFAVVLIIVAYNVFYVLSLSFYILIAIFEVIRMRRGRPYGVVTDTYGHALDMTIVRIYEKRNNRLIETDVNDAEGRFKFLVNPGVYYITATKPGYIDFKSHIMYLEKEKTMVSINIKMKKVDEK